MAGWGHLWGKKHQDGDKSMAGAPELGGDAGGCHVSPRVTATRATCRGCREDPGGRGWTERPLSCLVSWWLKVTGKFGGGGRKDGNEELWEAARQQGKHPAEPWRLFKLRCLYTTWGEGFLPESPAHQGWGGQPVPAPRLPLQACEQHRREQKKAGLCSWASRGTFLPSLPLLLCKTFTSLTRRRRRSKHSSPTLMSPFVPSPRAPLPLGRDNRTA